MIQNIILKDLRYIKKDVRQKHLNLLMNQLKNFKDDGEIFLKNVIVGKFLYYTKGETKSYLEVLVYDKVNFQTFPNGVIEPLQMWIGYSLIPNKNKKTIEFEYYSKMRRQCGQESIVKDYNLMMYQDWIETVNPIIEKEITKSNLKEKIKNL